MNRRTFLRSVLSLPLLGGLWRASGRSLPKRRLLLNRFSLAGFQYYQGPAVVNRLQAGERLALTPEPDNPYDRFAVEIHWRSVKLGYVPRSDNRHISRLLRQDADLVCRTVEVDPHAAPWQAVKAAVWLEVL